MEALIGPILLYVAAPIVTATIGAFAFLYRQIGKLQDKYQDCEHKHTELEFRLAVMQRDADQKDKEAEAIIVVDTHGMIREWSPGATLLFHWAQREALGKNVTMIMPLRYRDQYKKAWESLLAGNRTPRRGPHYAFGLTKEGAEVPVAMWYSGWNTGNINTPEDYGERMFGATIRFRVGLSEEVQIAPCPPTE